jgi:hypothetical protein
MDENGELVEETAREAIKQHGHNAVAVLRERAELADDQGDKLSAKAWRDIADAAERMLREIDQADGAPCYARAEMGSCPSRVTAAVLALLSIIGAHSRRRAYIRRTGLSRLAVPAGVVRRSAVPGILVQFLPGMGARAVLLRRQNWVRHSFGQWLGAAAKRLHRNVLAVALANKLARIAWGVLSNGRGYDSGLTLRTP